MVKLRPLVPGPAEIINTSSLPVSVVTADVEEGTSGSVSWGDRSVLPPQEVTEERRKSIELVRVQNTCFQLLHDNPPPSLPRQSRAGFGCLSHQPEQNSSQQFALLKWQASKNKRGGKEHPWVCFLIKIHPNWNPSHWTHNVVLRARSLQICSTRSLFVSAHPC